MRNAGIVKNERGQTIIIYALVVPILILFAGFAIDSGILYVTKAKLSTAVDGATLTGMKNLQSGHTTASMLATNIFDANYGNGAPTPTVTFPTDQYGDQQVQVSATVNVNTLFMRYLSNWRTVPVSDTAVATRGKLVMSIVLDRSGSMCGGTVSCPPQVTGDDGGEALQGAVPIFVDMFDNSLDEVALISFSDNATVNFPIATGFQVPIAGTPGHPGIIQNMQFVGGTFGTGAGTGQVLSSTMGPPLSLADAQNTSVTINPGQNVIKVLVYMTDGLMNAAQDKFYCGGKGGNPSNLTLVNYGGADYNSSYPYAVAFMDPTSPTTIWGWCNTGLTDDGCAAGLAYDSNGDICKDINGNIVKNFVSQQYGSEHFARCAGGSTCPEGVTAEAQYRAIQTANAMRSESPVPTYIYTIGLGNSVSTTTFFYVQNCPSTQCTADLTQVFETIAARVILRLTQ